jgi:hypothetical protein
LQLYNKEYLKKLGSQELGYRKGVQTTGGYFYISKQALSFFPELSKEIHNDSVKLEFSVEYRDCPFFLNLVYHNDKFNKSSGTRNEYRIYLTRDVAPDDFFFKPNDIIVIRRLENKKYFLLKWREGSELYDKLDSIISSSKIKGNHAFA